MTYTVIDGNSGYSGRKFYQYLIYNNSGYFGQLSGNVHVTICLSIHSHLLYEYVRILVQNIRSCYPVSDIERIRVKGIRSYLYHRKLCICHTLLLNYPEYNSICTSLTAKSIFIRMHSRERIYFVGIYP